MSTTERERVPDTSLRLGSLCTGYGGLDLAASSVLDVRPVWLCEFNRYAALVCEERFPGVPNLHDLTILDWQQVIPVDVLTAGYPCQPFSHAGRRKGTSDVRHLWPFIRDAIRVLRPGLVLLENVAGHLSLGFDVVLGDLAKLGLDAEWVVVRASDVGACHQRARVFIAAADADYGRRGGRGPSEADVAGDRDQAGERRSTGAGSALADADSERGEGLGRPETSGRLVALRGGEVAPDPQGGGHALLPEVDGGEPAMVGTVVGAGGGTGAGATPEGVHVMGRGTGLAWGEYEPAIRHHERVLGRASPASVDAKGRLSEHFVEWMQMLPEGWVTAVKGVSRPQALKILGNGVVPPQAAYAVRGLLARLGERTAA